MHTENMVTNGFMAGPPSCYNRPLNGFPLRENGEMQHPMCEQTIPYEPHLRQYAKDVYKARHGTAQAADSGTLTFSLKIPPPENAPRKVLLETPISPPLSLTGM
jgi:hypothetical protein